MKISVITVVLNEEEFIEECLKSVFSQTYDDVEYIIIDGGSTDGTLDVLKKYQERISLIISEPDAGIYDAMNKGIAKASGDIIGILNSDDIYADSHVLEWVEKVFRNNDCDACYADLNYVAKSDVSRVIRCWKSGGYHKENLDRSWIPPHPTLYVRKEVYDRCGLYSLNYKLAADYELMLRLMVRYNAQLCYIDKVIVKMRFGGATNRKISHIIKQNVEIFKARRNYGIKGSMCHYLGHKAISRLKQHVYAILDNWKIV